MADQELSRREVFRRGGLAFGAAISDPNQMLGVMARLIDQDPQQAVRELLAEWDQVVGQDLWFKTVMPPLDQLWKQYRPGPANAAIYEPIDDFFEKKLYRGEVKLADVGPNFDRGRRPVDQLDIFAIHHTATRDNVSPRNLSAIEMIRIYAKDYWENQKKYDGTPEDEDRHFDGYDVTDQNLWSNHIMTQEAERNGQKVVVEELTFAAYHYLVYPTTGVVVPTLRDQHKGYHGGFSNGRSIAVGVIGNFEPRTREMPAKGVDAIVDIFKMYKGRAAFTPDSLRGHRELPGARTECPGDSYYDFDNGWQRPLRAAIRAL